MLVLKVHFQCTTSLIDGQFHMFDRVNPVQAGSQAEFSQWLCHAHNVVNRRYYICVLNKPFGSNGSFEHTILQMHCELILMVI